MKQNKKSLNLPPEIAERIDRFVRANPGTNFTFVTIQALTNWLDNPQIILRNPEKKFSATGKEVSPSKSEKIPNKETRNWQEN